MSRYPSLLFFLFVQVRFEFSVFVKEPVGCAEHAELGATVQRVTNFLFLGREFEDVGNGERVALMEEGVGFSEFLVHHLRHLFAIAFRCEAVRLDAVLGEIFHDTFCSSLGESEIVVIVASEVAVCGKFNGDVRVLLQHFCQAVERFAGVFGQVRFVKFIKDIAHQYGNVDARQGKLENVLVLHF